MGKRSSFERVERDFYPTPLKAVEPLIPHLPDNCMFSEPCAGNGALVDHLKSLGHNCIWESDISPMRTMFKADALSLLYLNGIIITNPPWTRSILHRMIVHFSNMRPTWLLFDADWAHTKQAIPYLPRLRKIVAVGRVKWIPDSKHTGKDNCAWHLFTQPSDAPAEFYGRAAE